MEQVRTVESYRRARHVGIHELHEGASALRPAVQKEPAAQRVKIRVSWVRVVVVAQIVFAVAHDTSMT